MSTYLDNGPADTFYTDDAYRPESADAIAAYRRKHSAIVRARRQADADERAAVDYVKSATFGELLEMIGRADAHGYSADRAVAEWRTRPEYPAWIAAWLNEDRS